MEKYLPVERKARANARTRAVSEDTRLRAFQAPWASSLAERSWGGGLQMFALVGLCYKWTWFYLVGKVLFGFQKKALQGILTENTV